MKIAQFTFAIMSLGLAVYSLVTDNHEFSPFMFMFLSIFMLITGSLEIKEKRIPTAILLILTSMFVFFVSIYTM